MSSTAEPPSPKPDAKSLFGSPSTPSEEGVAGETARLSEEVEKLKDKLGEVIFASAFIIVIVIDLSMFSSFTTWTASIVIGILQFIFLFIFARICRVNDVMVITNLIFEAIERYKGSDRKPEE